MADIETPPLRAVSGHPPHAKPKQTRHVAFSEVSECSSIPGNYPRKSRRCCRCNCGSCCFVCCAWSCLGVLAVVLGILVLGVWFVSFIKSDLPEVRVQRLSFPGMRLANSSKQDTLLDTGVEVILNVTNKNEKIGISYKSMTAEVSLEEIRIGQAHVSGFFQEPRNQTMLKLATQVTRTVIPKEDGSDLQSDFKERVMVLDVVLNGTLALNFGRFKLQGLPFVIGCTDIKQAEVDIGLEPRCSIRVFAFK
ncbi:NDR1/HIN1-like protein 2 [Syzygium oleosum]|uniref:NDR1/HIN1-like protein 2 n=1 Tax=Syzygium oleosum TaxID=219896 RepID=UPI0024B96D54|nr:NDR1/HIN1-like protein 2 [Syzygium oleosum]